MQLSHIQRKLNVGFSRAEYLKKYIDYIETVDVCNIVSFDEDWEPIGPDIRAQLLKTGAVHEHAGLLLVSI